MRLDYSRAENDPFLGDLQAKAHFTNGEILFTFQIVRRSKLHALPIRYRLDYSRAANDPFWGDLQAKAHFTNGEILFTFQIVRRSKLHALSEM